MQKLGIPLIFIVFLVLLHMLLVPFGIHASEDESNYNKRNGIHTKCSYFDTVNVTGHPSFPNGSYSYEGTLIPIDYISTFHYIYDKEDRIEVPAHTRGCICKLKPCINVCCPWGFKTKSGVCQKDNKTELWPEPLINVTFSDGYIETVDLYEEFVVQSYKPCKKMFYLLPEEDAFQILENGTMLLVNDKEYVSRSEFCMSPLLANDTDPYYTITAIRCFESPQTTLDKINSYAMIFSIPFMLLTIAVYLWIPELRNEHGKSLVCYLSGLSIGYTLLLCLQYSDNINPSDLYCKIFGYTAYFAFLLAFFWLNVLCFDLWDSFRESRGVSHTQKKKRFLYYSLYAWGLALVFLIFTILVQEYSNWPENLKPDIGGDYCFLNVNKWSAMIYFHGPILIIIIGNIIMFVMTAIKIHALQREMARAKEREEGTKNRHTERDNFGLLLRLFLIMGVTWSSELYSYFVGKDSKYSNIFYISDLCNALQGLLIFVLFVLKKKVRRLIKRRVRSMKRKINHRNDSTIRYINTKTEISTSDVDS